jgi:hypothetical protein
MRTLSAVLLLLLAAGPLSAQTLSQPPLVVGQLVELRVESAPPGALSVFLFSPTGLGPGTCLPAPLSLCLDLLDPWYILAALPVDGGGVGRLPLLLPANLPLIPIFTQAVVAGGSFAKTNAIAAAILPITALSDPFDGTALGPAWRNLRPQAITVAISGGQLHLQLAQPACWFNDAEGGFVYQEITGDFTATVTVHARSAAHPAQPPAVDFSLGGLLARDPASAPGRRNWVHGVLGRGNGGVAVEDKTTVNSQSTYMLAPIPQPDGQLRLQRRGAVLSVFWRPIGSMTWQLLRTFSPPDRGPTLQVGPSLYTCSGVFDLRVSFDEFVVEP